MMTANNSMRLAVKRNWKTQNALMTPAKIFGKRNIQIHLGARYATQQKLGNNNRQKDQYSSLHVTCHPETKFF
jgi:hypothetical protein